jgi:hypothetical protein
MNDCRISPSSRSRASASSASRERASDRSACRRAYSAPKKASSCARVRAVLSTSFFFISARKSLRYACVPQGFSGRGLQGFEEMF